MDGEAEGRFQHLLLLEAHPQRQQETRHEPREVARQLDASALDEQVDDGEVEGLAAGRSEGLGPRADDVHAVPLTAQHHGDGASTGEVAIDKEDRGHRRREQEQATYQYPLLTEKDLPGPESRLPAV